MYKQTDTTDSPAIVRRRMNEDLAARGISQEDLAAMLGYKSVDSMNHGLFHGGYAGDRNAERCACLFGYDATYLSSGAGALYPRHGDKDEAADRRTDLAMQALGYLIAAGYDASDADAVTTLAVHLADMMIAKAGDRPQQRLTVEDIRRVSVSRKGAEAIHLALQVYPGSMRQVVTATGMCYNTLLPYYNGDILTMYDDGRRTRPETVAALLRYLRLDDYAERYGALPTYGTMPRYQEMVRELGYRDLRKEDKKEKEQAA